MKLLLTVLYVSLSLIPTALADDSRRHRVVVDWSEGEIGENMRAALEPYNTNRDPSREFTILVKGSGEASCSDLSKTWVEGPSGELQESPIEHLWAVRPEARYRKGVPVVSMDHQNSVGRISIHFDNASLVFSNDEDKRRDLAGHYSCECERVAIQRIGAAFEIGRFLGSVKMGPRRSGRLSVTFDSKCGRKPDDPIHRDRDAALDPVHGLDIVPWVALEWDDGGNKVPETNFERDYRSISQRYDKIYTVGLIKFDSFGMSVTGATFHGLSRNIQLWGHIATEFYANRHHFSFGPPFVTGDWRKGPQPSFFEHCASGTHDKEVHVGKTPEGDKRYATHRIVCNYDLQHNVAAVTGIYTEGQVWEGSKVLFAAHGDVQLFVGPRQHIESGGGLDAFQFNVGHCEETKRNCWPTNPCEAEEGACAQPPPPVYNETPMLDTNDITWCNRRPIRCPKGTDCACDLGPKGRSR